MGSEDLDGGEDALVTAYRRLQFLVGVLALLMPLVVVVGDWTIDDQELRGSISSYYYGRTGDVFVGVLWAIGVVLISYQVRPRDGFANDRWITTAAGIAAIGVALFPTSSDATRADTGSEVVALVHLLFAGVVFGLLAVLSLAYFTRFEDSEPGWQANLRRFLHDDPGIPAERTSRNRIHRACGWVMLVCIGLVVVSNALDLGWLLALEVVMVAAFSVSWFTKSIRRDRRVVDVTDAQPSSTSVPLRGPDPAGAESGLET